MVIIVTLILISIKTLILLIFIYSLIIEHDKEVEAREYEIAKSDWYIEENFGIMNDIVGRVKSGKSSFLSALDEACIRIIKRKLNERLEAIKNDLYYLDYNQVNNFLNNAFSCTNDIELVANSLYKEIDMKSYVLHDFVNVKVSNNLLHDYVEYYWHLYYKDCYLFTRGISLYDRVNDCPSKVLKKETLRLKEVKNSHIYYGGIAVVFSEDEKSASDSNIKSNNAKEKDSGTKETKIFFGHIGKELSYYNTTKQIYADEIITTRRLSIATYECIRAKVKLYNYPRLQRFLDFYLRIRYKLFNLRFIFTIGQKSRKKDLAYNSKKCGYRKAVAFVQRVKNWCDSKGLLVHEGRLYKYDVVEGKLKLVDEDVKLLLPYTESRGTYDCYEFHCLDDKLKAMSSVTADNIPFTQRFGHDLDDLKIEFLNDSVTSKEDPGSITIEDEY